MSENEEILDGLIKMLECVKNGNRVPVTDSILKRKLYNEDIEATMDLLENIKNNVGRGKNGKKKTDTVRNDTSVSSVDLQPILDELNLLKRSIDSMNESINSMKSDLEKYLQDNIAKVVQETIQQSGVTIVQDDQDIAQEENRETKHLITAEAGLQEPQEQEETEALIQKQSEPEDQNQLCVKETKEVPSKDDLSSDEDADEAETIEPKLSRHMEEVVKQYNQDGKNFIRADKLGLIKVEEERYAQMPKPFTSLAESQALTLEKKKGNGPFVAVLDEENIYFLLPKKKLLRSASEIKKSAVEKFFRVNSPDNLQGTYNQIFLLKPAVIEKNAEGKYHLKELGLIKVE